MARRAGCAGYCRTAPPTRAEASRTSFPTTISTPSAAIPARIGEIRTAKIIRPRYFDAAAPLLYAWRFAPGAQTDRHAQAICEIADALYQLGRGVDMAWAKGETLEQR